VKGTGAKRNVCTGSCVSTGAKFPVALVESAPMLIKELSKKSWRAVRTVTKLHRNTMPLPARITRQQHAQAKLYTLHLYRELLGK